MGDQPLSEYELLRLRNIERNRKVMKMPLSKSKQVSAPRFDKLSPDEELRKITEHELNINEAIIEIDEVMENSEAFFEIVGGCSRYTRLQQHCRTRLQSGA